MKFLTSSRRLKRGRSLSGFSLVTVMSVSLIATLLLTGLLAGTANVYRTVGSSKGSMDTKNAAEAAIDYAISQLNRSNGGEQFKPTTNETTAELTIAQEDTGVSGMVPAKVTIASCYPTIESSLFDPLYTLTTDQKWSMLAQPNYGVTYKSIRSRVTSGNFSEDILVIAKPSPMPQGKSSPTTPYFPNAAVSTNALTIGSNTITGEFDSSSGSDLPFKTTSDKYLGGDLRAYKKATLSGTGIEIGGSVDVDSINALNGFSAEVTSGSNVTVNRYLNVSENQSGFKDASTTSESPNVLGLSQAPAYPAETGPYVRTNLSPQQTSLPPAPTVSAADSASANKVSAAKGSDLKTGSNVVNSLTINSDMSTSGETRVYVENTSTSGDVVKITGNANSGSAPKNLQIWYNGSGKIQISPTNEIRATIYAPNATVDITGANSTSTFRGAVVSKNLSLSSIKFFADKSAYGAGASASSNLLYDPQSVAESIQYTAVSYRPKRH